MRLAFIGKGGSGKTTIAASFIKYLSLYTDKNILAIDSDHNVHLGDMLGIQPTQFISDKFDTIKHQFFGNRSELDFDSIISTTPPSTKSYLIRDIANNDFLKSLTSISGNIKLLTVGNYSEEDMGVTCYHGKLDSLQIILNHTIDNHEDCIVADATAGTDLFGSTLFTSYDLYIFVVEPTLKSISVYKDFKSKAKEFNLNLKVIVNKYSKEDEAFISKHIETNEILAKFEISQSIKKLEQGELDQFNVFIESNLDSFRKILAQLNLLKRDWDKYLRDAKQIHNKLALSWYNSYYNRKLDNSFDENFNYQNYIDD